MLFAGAARQPGPRGPDEDRRSSVHGAQGAVATDRAHQHLWQGQGEEALSAPAAARSSFPEVFCDCSCIPLDMGVPLVEFIQGSRLLYYLM